MRRQIDVSCSARTPLAYRTLTPTASAIWEPKISEPKEPSFQAVEPITRRTVGTKGHAPKRRPYEDHEGLREPGAAVARSAALSAPLDKTEAAEEAPLFIGPHQLEDQ
jgi:hypothetical protein